MATNAAANYRGTFRQGNTVLFQLKITDLDGNPQDAQEILVALFDPTDTAVVLTETVPENITEGFYTYGWEIPAAQDIGTYTLIWTYTVDDEEKTETQQFEVNEDATNVETYTEGWVSLRMGLEYHIRCAQSIPIYFEQARPTRDNQIYQFTFPRWNQSAGMRLYQNRQLINTHYDIDYFKGTVTLDEALTEYDQLFADYNFKWFNDEDLNQFLQNALNEMNVAPPFRTWTIDDLVQQHPEYVPGVLYGAAKDALRTLMLCIQFQQPAEIFGGPEGAQQAFSNFNTIKENYEKSFDRILTNKKFGPYPGTQLIVTPEYTLPGGRSVYSGSKTLYLLQEDNSFIVEKLSIKEAFDIFNTGKKMYVISHKNGSIIYSLIGKVFKSGIKKMYILKTENGLTIKSSKEHLFYVNGEYLPLEDIRIGDNLLSCVNNEIKEDRVKNIIETGEETEMYDIDVPYHRNLFIEGINCHNSRWFRYLYK